MVLIVPFNSNGYVQHPELLDEMLNSLLGKHWYESALIYARDELQKIVSDKATNAKSFSEMDKLVSKDFVCLYKALSPALGMLFEKELLITLTWKPSGESTFIFIEIDESVWSADNDYSNTTV